MKTMNLGICSAVAAVAVAGSASAVIVPTVIDNFTTAGALGANGANYGGLGTFSVGTSGSWPISGHRLLCTNSSGGTSNGTMSGNGQFAASASGVTDPSADAQVISQYKFSSVVDMTNSNFSTIYVSGSGTASGGGTYSYVDIDWDNYDESAYDSFGNYTGAMKTYTETKAGYGIGVAVFTGATATGGFSDIAYAQLNMIGTRSLGNFAFTLADLQASNATFDFSAVNAMFVFQYAYGNGEIAGIDGGTWDYTATSFSFVPAPGALALLGVAGVVGSRRRR